MMKKSSEKLSSYTRQKILSAARQIAVKDGVSRLTLEAVAGQAGISKGGLLYHFSSKRELVIAMMDEYVNHLENELNEALENCKGNDYPLVRAFINWFRKYDGIEPANQLWGAAVFAVQSFDPTLMEPLHNWYKQLFSAIRESSGDKVKVATMILALEGLFLLNMYKLDYLTTEEKSSLIRSLENSLDD